MTIDPEFEEAKASSIANLASNARLQSLGLDLMRETGPYRYTYNFTWLGLPVIQFPQDLIAIQEIVWDVRPEVIIETGVARGGSVIFYASLLELLGSPGHVIGIDVEIRAHNRRALEAHPLHDRFVLIEGSSIDSMVVDRVFGIAQGRRALVLLDSMHSHDHVLAELDAYSPLVSEGSYLIVLDTTIEDQPSGYFEGKPWDRGDNPKTAVGVFLARNDRFVVDHTIDGKLLLTSAHGGYLRCVRDSGSEGIRRGDG